MKRLTQAVTFVTGVALLVTTTFLASAIAQSTAPKNNVVFTYGSHQDVDSMNQFIMVSYGYTIHALSYDLLVGFSNKDLSPTPDIAQSWENSPDGLTWTYHLNPNFKWSDGVPLTANDVVYTYNRVIDEHQGCCFSYLKLVKSVTAPDDHTVVIKTTAPTLQMLSIYTYIYPEHIWSKVSASDIKTYENFPAVTSGPFHPTVWKKGQFMRLDANPNYPLGAPKIDEFDFKVYNNQDAEVQALKNGELDFVDGIQPNLFNSLKTTPGVATHIATINEFDDLAFNTGGLQGDGNPALRDPVFRKALSMAIDKQTLVQKVLNGYGTPGSTVVAPFTAAYHLDIPQTQQIPFDIAGANKLLDDAGYKDTDGNGIRNEKGGGPDINLRYYLASSVDASTPTAQFVTQWWKQIGIGTTVKSYSDGQLTDIEVAGTYDVVHWDWFPDPDPDFILSVLTCAQRPEVNPQGQNVGGIWSDTQWCNQTYDQQYTQQKSITDVTGRADVIKKMQQEVYDAAPYAVLWYQSDLQGYSSKWAGFTPQPSPDGDLLALYGNTSLRSVHLSTAGAKGTSTKGISAGVLIGVAVGVLVVIAVVVLARRRRSDEDVA